MVSELRCSSQGSFDQWKLFRPPITSKSEILILFFRCPTMNQARKNQKDMRERENESCMVYPYRFGRTLVRSSGICPENERHPHVIKAFISSLQCGVRNKIAKKWSTLRNSPHTVQEAFDLEVRMETQMQVTNTFKLELSGSCISADINEIIIGDLSIHDLEVNEVSSGRKWNNNYKKDGYNNNWYNIKNQGNSTGNRWECRRGMPRSPL